MTPTCTEEYLRLISEMTKASTSIEAFVWAQGQRFDQFRDRPRGVRKGQLGRCFKNAADLVLRTTGLIYCEGYAECAIPVLHAWALDRRGRVIETTWPEHGLSYYGIAFSRCYLLQALARSNWYCLLDQHRHPELIGGKINPKEFLHPMVWRRNEKEIYA
jgi:hypothetical protein